MDLYGRWAHLRSDSSLDVGIGEAPEGRGSPLLQCLRNPAHAKPSRGKGPKALSGPATREPPSSISVTPLLARVTCTAHDWPLPNSDAAAVNSTAGTKPKTENNQVLALCCAVIESSRIWEGARAAGRFDPIVARIDPVSRCT